MAARKQVAVIGLGRFGASMCRTLMDQGLEVLGVDSDPKRITELATIATHVVGADATDERVIEELGLAQFDHVVIAIGEDIQASILASLMVKQAGVADVWAKAKSDYHAKVLELIGVDHVVHAERDMAVRTAHLIASEALVDFIELSRDHRLVELAAPASMDGRTLRELDLRARFGVTIVGFRRGQDTTISPDPDARIATGDVLFAIGENRQLDQLQAHARA